MTTTPSAPQEPIDVTEGDSGAEVGIVAGSRLSRKHLSATIITHQGGGDSSVAPVMMMRWALGTCFGCSPGSTGVNQ